MAYELQKSFAAGEISPKKYLRNDGQYAALHAASLKSCINMSPTSHGPLESRMGFDQVDSVYAFDKYIKLFPFNINDTESYCVSIDSSILTVYDEDGVHKENNLIADPHFFYKSFVWGGLVKFVGGIARIDNGLLYQRVFLLGGTTEHTVEIYGSDLFNSANSDSAIEIRIGTNIDTFDIAQFTNQIGKKIVITFTHNILLTEFYLTIRDNGNIRDLRKVNSFATLTPVETSFASPWSFDNNIESIKTIMVPGQNKMYLFSKSISIDAQELTYSSGSLGKNKTWTLGVIPFTSGANPIPWGSTSAYSATFYDSRLVLGGSFNKPSGIWLSKPNDYTNFDVGTGIAGDALDLPLAKTGEVQWVNGNKKLIIGMNNSEHLIFTSGGGISPSNAQTNQQSEYGSSTVNAVIVGEEIAFVSSSSRKVRLMNYVRDEEGWASYDISFNSEHISKELISEMSFDYSPIGRFVFRKLDGTLILCNFERDQGTYGWYRYETDAYIHSSAITRKYGEGVTWISTFRNGQSNIEVQATKNSNHHMDSTIEVVAPFGAPSNTFTGFDHLIGRTVQVLADDKVHPDLVVAVGGIITLSYVAAKIIVGLGFNKEIETLPEISDIQSGSSFNHSKRWSNMAISVIDSSRPIVNGSDTFLRIPATLMVERESFKSEIIDLPDLGWSKESTMTISQPLPLPLNISGIGGKLKNNKL